jgi:hypothetical protein
MRWSVLWVFSHVLGFPLGLFVAYTLPPWLLRLADGKTQIYWQLYRSLYLTICTDAFRLFVMGMTATIFTAVLLLAFPRHDQVNGAAEQLAAADPAGVRKVG